MKCFCKSDKYLCLSGASKTGIHNNKKKNIWQNVIITLYLTVNYELLWGHVSCGKYLLVIRQAINNTVCPLKNPNITRNTQTQV